MFLVTSISSRNNLHVKKHLLTNLSSLSYEILHSSMFVWREVVRIICYLKQTAVLPQFWRSPHCCPTRPWPVWFYRTGTRRTGVAHLEKQSTIALFLVFALKKFVLGSIHQNEQNISLSWAVCCTWQTRVKLKTFQPL